MAKDDIEYLDSLPRCANCGEGIEEHEKESDPPWMCPYDHQFGSVYGFFCGGDPRSFSPGGDEDATPKERENHRLACELADRLEAEGKSAEIENPSGYVYGEDGKLIAHVLRAPFGLGVTTFPPTYYEKPAETKTEVS